MVNQLPVALFIKLTKMWWWLWSIYDDGKSCYVPLTSDNYIIEFMTYHIWIRFVKMTKNRFIHGYGYASILCGLCSLFITPPRNRGGVIFSLQFVCVSVCLCVCPALLVNKIPTERMHRFGRGFHLMIASRTGSDPIEFGDLGSKVKFTRWRNTHFFFIILC